MKRLIISIALALTSCQALAGDYDGVWRIAALPEDYFLVRSVNETLVAVRLSSNFYEILLGPLKQTQATLSSFKSTVNTQASIVFSSSQEAIVTIQSCEPAAQCQFQSGTVIHIEKFF